MRQGRKIRTAGSSAMAAMAMLDRAADGAMLVDERGIIRFWNHAAERLLGFRSEEVLGRPCHEVMKGETEHRHRLCSATCSIGRRLACGRGVRNFMMLTRTKGGWPMRLNISSLPVPPESKTGRCAAAHLFRAVKTWDMKPPRRDGLLWPGRRGPGGGRPAAPPLTVRELEVLRRLAHGESTGEISDRLCISRTTVRNHVQHLLEKLGAHSRLQALAVVYRSGGLG